MNKNEFINLVNEKSGISKKDCKLCLETILSVITDCLSQGKSLTLSNFGKFKVNNIKSKSIYNFQTKSKEIVDARKTPIFKASDNLKQCIK